MTRARPLTSPADLLKTRLITRDEADALGPVADHYAMAITPFLEGQIDRNDPNDPIRAMFVPRPDEMRRLPEELEDPIGDDRHTPVAGVVHRYPNRALLKPVAVCPVYCRFCFRREMVGPELGEALSPGALEAALDYIRAHDEITEVILTGGDPFMLSARRAKALTQSLSEIPHLQVIRWHTRMPVADPARVTSDYAAALSATEKAVFVSIHINHLRELTPEARQAARRMACAGISLISQSVLLRGVNADAETLADLFQGLISAGVKPYYLHHPDLAPGTGHFRLSLAEGQAIFARLRDRVSGIALPHYVIDIPGGVSKANVPVSEVQETAEGQVLRGRDNQLYPYKK